MIVDVGNKEELEDRYATVKLHYLEGKTMIPVSLIVICILLGMREVTSSRFIKLYIL